MTATPAEPDPAIPQPPSGAAPEKKKRRKWPFILLALIVLIIIAANSGGSSPMSSSAAGSASATPSSTADTSTSASSAAPSSTAASPTPAPVTPAPIPAPVVFKGNGDDVVSITKPTGAKAVIATITGGAGGSNFAVKGVDGDKDLLVNTIGQYSGSDLMDAQGGDTTQLQVTATGPWSITLSHPRSAPPLNSGPNSGTGDTVLLYQGGSGKATIDGPTVQDNFVVQEYSGNGNDLLVNEIGAYHGTVPLHGGPALVAVKAGGKWSITVG